MRVTHVITRLITGGAQENTIASVLGLAQKPGMQVRLISGPTSGPEGSLEAGFAQYPGMLSVMPQLVRPVHPWKDWLAWRKLVAEFKRDRPDLVHTHSGKAGILGRLAAAKVGVRLIVHTIHGPSFGPFQGALSNAVFSFAERRAGQVTTHFVTVADAMKEQYLAAGIGRPEQYTRVFSGFPLHPYLNSGPDSSLRSRFGLAEGDFVVGVIARLFKLKGHDELFGVAPELLKQVPNLRILLVGDGPWRERFEKRIQELGLERCVVFAGLVPPERIPALVGIMDILVHLSRREGLPRALPQALAGGKPVVAYDCDGAREVCLDGKTGFLIPPGDLPMLRNRVQQLAEQPELRERLGRAGRAMVRELFPVERMVDDLYRLYLDLDKRSSRPAR